jgi:hypothetical protein
MPDVRMHKSHLTILPVTFFALLVAPRLPALADETPAVTPGKDEVGQKVAQITHPFGTLGALRDVTQWKLITKHTLTEGQRSLVFFLYAADSDNSKDGARDYPNSFDLLAVYESGKNKWSIETIYSVARVGFVRLMAKEKDYIDVELASKFIVRVDLDRFGEEGKEIDAPNRKFAKRISLKNGKLIVEDGPSKTTD